MYLSKVPCGSPLDHPSDRAQAHLQPTQPCGVIGLLDEETNRVWPLEHFVPTSTAVQLELGFLLSAYFTIGHSLASQTPDCTSESSFSFPDAGTWVAPGVNV